MIMQRLFTLMTEKHASDIFVSAGTAVHIKIQGVAIPVGAQIIDSSMARKMAYEVMTPEQIEEFEKTKEMNLSFASDAGNFRISVFMQRGTVALVVRYITAEIPPLASLKLPAILPEIIMEKRGLVLVVGSTGSGKSTTLAAMLDHRNIHKPGHILTLEDPIEFIFKHKKSIVNQREIGMDSMSYAAALKNALRQAPDCILIGEIRDKETMTMAMTYAQSGHLCLATLHANNSYHALNRIINFFPLESRPSLLLDLSISLKCIISQRLVKNKEDKRTAAVEVLLNTRHISELVEKGQVNEIKEAMEQSLSPGSQTFEQDLFRLFSRGDITIEEALDNADSPTNLSWLINNATGGITSPAVPAADRAAADKGPDAPVSGRKEGASFSGFNLSAEDTTKQ